jgi:Family of unknown function (DUF5675)
MEITVNKVLETRKSTLSLLSINGIAQCWVLEDGYRAVKVPGETRIPAGTYEVRMRTHGTFFDEYRRRFAHDCSLEVANVPFFSDILIHIGNTNADTRGCLLVAQQANLVDVEANALGGSIKVENSTAAYRALYKHIRAAFAANQKVTLTILR